MGRVLWLHSLLVLLYATHATIFFANERMNDQSLCGEPEKRHNGFLNGLYYIFYETRSKTALETIPLVVWLSGGPGCSSLVGMLFENGPCMVGEETPATAKFNKYSWTKSAHVLYIDQPRGTGFSPSRDVFKSWSEVTAVDDLVKFMSEFYDAYPEFAKKDLYIFGESYAGHYVPDLAHAIAFGSTSTDSNILQLRNNLKGIGIGNGLTSAEALFETIGPYIKSLSPSEKLVAASNSLVDNCVEAIKECQDSTDGGNNDCSKVFVCDDLMSKIMSQIRKNGLNHYNLNKKCIADMFNLCYRFQPLYSFINSKSNLEKLGLPGQAWTPCNLEVFSHHLDKDYFEESEFKVAKLLEASVRVLIYAGDRDSVCNWMSQDLWTRTMKWAGQNDFSAAPIVPYKLRGVASGEARSSHGLTFFRVYNAGHMVPLDQPAVALDMLKRFISNQSIV